LFVEALLASEVKKYLYEGTKWVVLGYDMEFAEESGDAWVVGTNK
jgi:hypothetical protein